MTTTAPLVVDAVADALRAEGVEWISCYPTTPLIDAVTRAGIRPVLCRQERVGVGIADGFARVAGDGRFGVFAMQYGPGAENAFPGIASAYSDGIPILLLPLGNKLDRSQQRPLFGSGRSYLPVTKAFETLVRAEDVADVMRRAVSALRNGPPGPVMVELPEDLARSEVPDAAPRYRPVAAATTMADPVAVERAVTAVLAARNPVILAGAGILRSGASPELIELAELLRLPVLTTLGGKSAFPERHPLSLGVASVVISDPAMDELGSADLVLALGASLTRHFLSARLPADATLVHLTVDPRDLHKTYSDEHPLLGDARAALRQLIDAARERRLDARPAPAEVEGRIASAQRAWLARWRPRLTSDEVPITPYRVLHEFMLATDPDRTIVTHDSGSPRDQIVPFYRSGGPNTYLGWGKSHALGAGLGLIIGAKLAAPDKLCVHFMGDAAFGMTGLDVETAVRSGIPVAWIVLNNSTMAVEIPSMRESHDHYAARDIGGDYADLARALNVEARRVERPEELAAAFEFARRTTEDGRCALIEVITSAETAFANRKVMSA